MTLKSLATIFLIYGYTMSPTWAFGPPAWLKPLLNEHIEQVPEKHASIDLLDYKKVEYLRVDRTRYLIRGATRVITLKGKSDAVITVGYNGDVGTVKSAKAWIISADGQDTEEFARESFSDQAANLSGYTWDSYRFIGFAGFSRVPLNGVMAWEIEIETASGVFDSTQSFDRRSPLLHGIFEVHPCKGGILQSSVSSPKIPAPTQVGTGGLRWEMQNVADIDPAGVADFIPEPLDISVRCIVTGSSHAANTWSDLAKLTGGLIEPKIEITPELKLIAENLTKGKLTRWERVRALTEFIQKEITYLAITQDKDTLAGYRPHAAPEVMRRRYGDCKDKATFLAALMRAIGDQSYIVLVYSGNPSAIRADWPSARFNHAIAAIPGDADTPAWWPLVDGGSLGKLVLFDPTNPFRPLGVLPVEDQGGYGLIAHAAGSLLRLPGESIEHAHTTRKIQAKLTVDGTISLKINEDHLGIAGASYHEYREAARRDQFGTELARNIQARLPLFKDLQWSDAWSPTDIRFSLELSGNVARHARPLGTDKLLFIPETIPLNFDKKPWRPGLEGIAWKPTQVLREETRLTLPEGYSVLEMPKAWKAEAQGTTAELTYRVEGSEFIFERTLIRPPAFVERSGYEAIRTLMENVQSASRRPVLLKRN